MKNICGIYKITSPTGRIYIGQSIDIDRRKREYKKMNCRQQIRLYRSIKKHGFESHTFEILQQCHSSQLNELECLCILIYDSFDTKNGMNLKSGGEGGGKWSKYVRMKLSKLKTGKKFTQEHKNKLIEAWKSRAPASKETKLKLSLSGTGRVFSQETKNKIGAAHRGKKESLETIVKMRERMKGKYLFDNLKPVSQYTADGKTLIQKFDSITIASKECGIIRTAIANNLSKKTKTSGGYLWLYQ